MSDQSFAIGDRVRVINNSKTRPYLQGLEGHVVSMVRIPGIRATITELYTLKGILWRFWSDELVRVSV